MQVLPILVPAAKVVFKCKSPHQSADHGNVQIKLCGVPVLELSLLPEHSACCCQNIGCLKSCMHAYVESEGNLEFTREASPGLHL